MDLSRCCYQVSLIMEAGLKKPKGKRGNGCSKSGERGPEELRGRVGPRNTLLLPLNSRHNT